MTPQPTLTAPARNGRRTGTGTRAVRRRALVAALGLAVLAAVVPVTAAHADPSLPDFPQDLANPTENPDPPLPPDLPDFPGPKDLANPTENPDPPLPPEPPDGPDDLVNPTENPQPPTPPVDHDPAPSGDSAIPTPQRNDAGFGGTAAGSTQAAGVALIAAALLLALLVAVVARRQRSGPWSPR
jgi:hypothetical protein